LATRETFDRLFGQTQRSAVHLEMRDTYPADERAFLAWQVDGGIVLDDPDLEYWAGLIHTTVARGVEVRRARIVSEPVTRYIRFEYEATAPLNVAVGEQVRWLPRRQTTDIALPGNDFWLFDDHTLLVDHFSGDGDWTDTEIVSDPAAIKLCAEAFEAVWLRAIDNADYKPV